MAFTASLSRSQGREGWSIIFRHPLREDRATGKPGLRVRRGLRTKARAEAEKLVEEMNQLLSDPGFWDLSAKPNAMHRFDERVVEIFYSDVVPEPTDFFSLRDSVIPLPAADTDYRRVLLVGTTGGGKTTLARQLLGTDPDNERFPSTSAGKTTVSDMELVLDDGPYRAVVTFLPREQVRDYLEECMSAAALEAYRTAGECRGDWQSLVLRRLLHHVNQRFRLNYILGNGPTCATEEEDQEEEESEAIWATPGTAFDLEHTNQLLGDAVVRLRQMAGGHAEQLRKELGADPGDERVLEEIFEENLDHILRDEEDFQALADDLMEEIELRFDQLSSFGQLEKTKQGWPRLWRWETIDRQAFLEAIRRFSSNHAKHFGTLLSPLVGGMRVAGPFKPDWLEQQPKIVLLDGEGLGHTPDTSASIPTALTRRFDDVDVVLLVDNATQPMQAAPVVLMRGLAASGKTSKLLTCFTHMDLVRGDNIPSFRLQKQHVLASAENVLSAIGEQLGRFAERALRQALHRGCFFVGAIDCPLKADSKPGRRTIDQFLELLTAAEAVREVPTFVGSRPIYDRVNLVLAVKNAAEKFHDDWLARLGYSVKPNVTKEHWTRVKALTRRLAEGWADEYDTLKPVADLHRNLQNDVYVFVQNPMRWDGPEPSDDEKQQIFDRFAEAISGRVLELATRRLREEHVPDWQEAYNRRGTGSTYQRAAIIKDEIYEKAAPVPDVTPSPDKNRFLHEVIRAVDEAAQELEVVLK